MQACSDHERQPHQNGRWPARSPNGNLSLEATARIAVALDGGCLLEIQPSEELDEDCQLIPQACVSLSSSLNPISDAKMEGSLRGKLFRIAGRQLENFGPVLSR